jgi:hypothetical protein
MLTCPTKELCRLCRRLYCRFCYDMVVGCSSRVRDIITHSSNITDMSLFSAESTLVLKRMISYEKFLPRTMAMTLKSQAISLFRCQIPLLPTPRQRLVGSFSDHGLDIDYAHAFRVLTICKWVILVSGQICALMIMLFLNRVYYL